MNTYVLLVNWTEKGMREVRQSPKRFDEARALLKDMGGEFKSFYMTMGEHDIVGIYEAPDDAIAARFSLLLGAVGYVRTKTLKAYPDRAYREIINSLG